MKEARSGRGAGESRGGPGVRAEITSDPRQVGLFWSRQDDAEGAGFWTVPGWQEHQNLLVTGNPEASWLDLAADHFRAAGARPGVALSLGCGRGWLERELISRGLCLRAEGCDVSEALLEEARLVAEASGLPIRYYWADLNAPVFPETAYNLIAAAGVLHHVERLETLCENLRRALRPGGWLLVYDYTGPSRFQWTDLQIAIGNEWISRVPPRFLRKRGYPWYARTAKRIFDAIPFSHSPALEPWARRLFPQTLAAQFLRLKAARLEQRQVIRLPPEHFAVTDPSEAVRSADVLPVLEHYFRVELARPCGGTLAQPIFTRIAGNFANDAEGCKIAQEILADERRRIEKGELPSDFMVFLARGAD